MAFLDINALVGFSPALDVLTDRQRGAAARQDRSAQSSVTDHLCHLG